jgi:DNA ligase (NAD+)
MSQEEIDRLRTELRRHTRLYYAGQTEITDAVFDHMMTRLRELEEENPELQDPLSPTKVVGSVFQGDFETLPHDPPMLSVDNCFDLAELDRFYENVASSLNNIDVPFSVEYKIDGVALALRYRNGLFDKAMTRGDGESGDVVTHNALTILDLPWVLSGFTQDDFEIRGEAYIRHSDFTEVKAELEQFGEEAKNSRNTCAGALRQHDPAKCRRRRVRFMAHGFGNMTLLEENAVREVMSHSDLMTWFREKTVPTVPHSAGGFVWPEVKTKIDELVELMPTLDFPVDGIVVKVDQLGLRARLGAGSKYPNWIRAYKWERFEAETTVRDITVQVGKHGTLTPVAELEPAEIDGTTVSRASLFNQDEIDRLDVRIGDSVVVEKAGKIIPHIVRVILPRSELNVRYRLPATCPECNSPAVRQRGEAATKCINEECPARVKAVLLTFCNKRHLDIAGFGEVLINQLVDRGMVRSIPGLFQISSNDFQQLDKVGERKAAKLCQALGVARERDPWRLLAGLNIPLVGREVSQMLLQRYRNIPALFSCIPEDFTTHDGIGDKIAKSLCDWMDKPQNQALIVALARLGCRMEAREEAGVTGGPLTGMTIVPTGVLRHYERDEIKDVIREYGGKPTSSVSKKTTYVLAGSEPGQKKLIKARELEIPVITEEQFQELIEGILIHA